MPDPKTNIKYFNAYVSLSRSLRKQTGIITQQMVQIGQRRLKSAKGSPTLYEPIEEIIPLEELLPLSLNQAFPTLDALKIAHENPYDYF